MFWHPPLITLLLKTQVIFSVFSNFSYPFQFVYPSATELQSGLYVATCSPARDTGSGYVARGHSTLVGPNHLKCADYESGTNLPVTKQRRVIFISWWIFRG
ncbi:hypothetical protein JHK85_009404 [Glycine max]|uniref:Secreted protein n=1 Tax=Glycine max TaxID=3847 RepID=K7KI93_SOYBN|nr:hypothetical protein JHK85_009404 [Glycine max]KAG5065418.1 hypothetical protein JHK86_009149 [Glycine max]